MSNHVRRAARGDGGFTLIELLVVIIIIGILAAIAIPVFLNQRIKGYDANAKADLRNAATAEESYLSDQGTYTMSTADLLAAGWKQSSHVTSFTVPNLYTAANAQTTTQSAGTGGYCLAALSKSGTTFYYDSTSSGFVPACR